MYLQKIVGKSKESGKEYVAWQLVIDKWKSQYLFLSEFEIEYIKDSGEIEVRES